MFSTACRSLSLALFSIFLGVVIVSTIILTSVRAQQSGAVQQTSATNETKTGILATNSNNYAANIAALTVGKPVHYQALNPPAHHHRHLSNLLDDNDDYYHHHHHDDHHHKDPAKSGKQNSIFSFFRVRILDHSILTL